MLKVSNAAEDRGVVEMEVAAVEHIAAVDPGLPVPVAAPALDGSTVSSVEIGDGVHLVLLPLSAQATTPHPGVHDITTGCHAGFIGRQLTVMSEPESQKAGQPVGTGPFKFVRSVPGERLTVARNEHYWQPGVPRRWTASSTGCCRMIRAASSA